MHHIIICDNISKILSNVGDFAMKKLSLFFVVFNIIILSTCSNTKKYYGDEKSIDYFKNDALIYSFDVTNSNNYKTDKYSKEIVYKNGEYSNFLDIAQSVGVEVKVLVNEQTFNESVVITLLQNFDYDMDVVSVSHKKEQASKTISWSSFQPGSDAIVVNYVEGLKKDNKLFFYIIIFKGYEAIHDIEGGVPNILFNCLNKDKFNNKSLKNNAISYKYHSYEMSRDSFDNFKYNVPSPKLLTNYRDAHSYIIETYGFDISANISERDFDKNFIIVNLRSTIAKGDITFTGLDYQTYYNDLENNNYCTFNIFCNIKNVSIEDAYAVDIIIIPKNSKTISLVEDSTCNVSVIYNYLNTFA